jgi:hypothetical protein
VLVIGSLVLACALGELAVRLLLPQQLIIKRPDVWQGIERLGWAHRPNVRATINTGERTVLFVTDEDGYRVGRSGRVAGNRRILLLGDSFVEAAQVEFEESLAGLLESRLSRRAGSVVAVRNTGVGGWDPPQYLVQARMALGREPFDLVLVAIFLGNDIVRDPPQDLPARAPVEEHEFRWPRRLSYGEVKDALLYPVNDVLEVRSQLFVLLKTRLGAVLMRLGLSAEYFPQEFFRSEAASPRWEVTATICEDIAKLAAAAGAPTVFLLLPAVFQVERSAFEEYLDGLGIDRSRVDLEQPNELLGAALRARGLTIVDVLPVLREAQSRGIRAYGNVDRHLSAEGHAVIAQHLEPIVASYLESQAMPITSGRSAEAPTTTAP